MDLQKWTPDTSYEFFVYKLILWPLGIWPLNKNDIFSEIRLFLTATTQVTTFICLSLEIWKNCRGVEIVLDLFVLSVFSLLACVKGLIVHHNIIEVHHNLVSAVDDWWNLSQKSAVQNRQIMMKYARLGRLVCFSLMVPASSGTLSWIILALPLPIFSAENNTDPIKNFPLQTACTFQSVADSRFYYVIFMLQVYQLIATCLGNCGNDVFFFGLAMHACGQLEILQNNLMKIQMRDEALRTMVNRHSHLIDLVKKLEITFNLIILAQLIMSGVLICILGLQLIIALKTGDMFAAIKANIVLSSLMSQLFLYSYGGDCLTYQNTSVVLSIYKSTWYEASLITMKNVGFIMMRANKPIYVTAGKFFYMTLSTFMDILKASVSYLSVLRVAIDV